MGDQQEGVGEENQVLKRLVVAMADCVSRQISTTFQLFQPFPQVLLWLDFKQAHRVR
jgi:hypothetical protein